MAKVEAPDPNRPAVKSIQVQPSFEETVDYLVSCVAQQLYDLGYKQSVIDERTKTVHRTITTTLKVNLQP